MTEQVLSEKEEIKKILDANDIIVIQSLRDRLAYSLVHENSQVTFKNPQELFDFIKYLNQHSFKYKMKKRSFKESIKSMIPFSIIILLFGSALMRDSMTRFIPIALIVGLTFINMMLPTKTLIIKESFE